ncbi:hypothetical protein BBJ28_00012109 [Nothophytophthora sp. Chile5]|nr:hypothetical protein BBJ28_00012109 [Nothophytophthora sp. Chile5]
MGDGDALLLGDCQELQRRGLISSQQLLAWESALASPQRDEIRAQVSTLLQQEADALVDRVRLQQNAREREGFAPSDLAAVAAGGALGALNAWLRPAPTAAVASRSSPAPTLWASAFDGAAASLNVARRKRHVAHLKLVLLSGDPSVCDHVVLCVNGFMTQSDDPARNWSTWSQLDERVAVFAVEWEAGDAAAWNDFCTHVNDNLGSSSASAMITHFSGNPWHSAQGKATQVGVLLARVLAERPAFLRGRKLSLFGHSLGGAVIYSTFQELAKLRDEKQGRGDGVELPRITNAVSFAGAFIPNAQGLENVTRGLEPNGGRFINVFSARDGVLTKLFWALQLPGPNDPAAAGCEALAFTSASSVNVEVSDLIAPRVENHFGHGYSQCMETIKSRVLPHLLRK